MGKIQPPLAQLEQQMRAGQGQEVRKALVALGRRFHPDRGALARWAQLAWRSGLPEKGLSWLYPYVRPPERKKVYASPEEIAEYGACLIKWGAAKEALQVLEHLSANDTPVINLYRAFGKINNWEYGEAIPYLETYLEQKDLELYPRLVAEVNLISALVFEHQFDAASEHIKTNIRLCEKYDFRLAGARLHELNAELHIATRDFHAAGVSLDRAEVLLADRQSLESFFIRKYRAAALAYSQPVSAESRQAVDAIEREARDRKHWETIRDVDRIRAIAFSDEKILARLYFGTPYPSYRGYLLQEKPVSLSLPDAFSWRLGGKGPGPVLELFSATWSPSGKPVFKSGMTHHRLLLALASDFYRPLRTSTLFSEVFPQERYIPVHSAERVRKAISRLRAELKRLRLPLVIEEENGNYRLAGTNPVAIGLQRESRVLLAREDGLTERLLSGFAGRSEFSAIEVASLLGVTPRTAQRLLQKALTRGLVGHTKRRARYCLRPLSGEPSQRPSKAS